MSLADDLTRLRRGYRAMALRGQIATGSYAHVAAIQRLLEQIRDALDDGSIRSETGDERAAIVALLRDMQSSASRAFEVWIACYRT